MLTCNALPKLIANVFPNHANTCSRDLRGENCFYMLIRHLMRLMILGRNCNDSIMYVFKEYSKASFPTTSTPRRLHYSVKLTGMSLPLEEARRSPRKRSICATIIGSKVCIHRSVKGCLINSRFLRC